MVGSGSGRTDVVQLQVGPCRIRRFNTLLKEWSNGYSFEGVPRAGQI